MEKTEVVIDSKLQSNLNSLIENTLVEKKMEEELDFFLSNNASQPKNMQQKKIKVYNTTRINSRNVLTNISSNEVKEENFFFWQLRTDNKKH